MKRGMRISITGIGTNLLVTGTIIGINDVAVNVMSGSATVVLRRDPASTKPDQWRIGGMPVTVKELPQPKPSPAALQNTASFRRRLAELEARTRHMGVK
jgi:hypothetical protein